MELARILGKHVKMFFISHATKYISTPLGTSLESAPNVGETDNGDGFRTWNN